MTCQNCKSEKRIRGDGLCDECAHVSLYQMRQTVGEQQATIERTRNTVRVCLAALQAHALVLYVTAGLEWKIITDDAVDSVVHFVAKQKEGE